jgi:hypothetical protein
MSTRKLPNVSDLPRMRTTVLPDGMILRLARGVLCPCGRPVQNYPRQLGWPNSFSLICDACHHDVLVYEPHQC